MRLYTNLNRTLGPFGKLNPETLEDYLDLLETNYEGEFEASFQSDWVSAVRMGRRRPIGFNGEQRIENPTQVFNLLTRWFSLAQNRRISTFEKRLHETERS